MEVTLEEAIELINEKKQTDEKKHLKQFAEEPELEVLNGRFGPYLHYKGNNYKLPKSQQNLDTLTVEKCLEIIQIQDSKTQKAKANKS